MDYVIKNVSAQELSQRFTDKFEVYNEEMSPTSVDIGYDHKMNVQVAIKHVHKDQLLSQQQKNQAIIECTAHSLLKHQNLVQLYDCFQTDKEYTLILEYMNQANYFKEKIDENLKPISNEEKLKTYLLDILEGLNYTHKLGYIHCDIKLENLFCHKDEETETRIVFIYKSKNSRLKLEILDQFINMIWKQEKDLWQINVVQHLIQHPRQPIIVQQHQKLIYGHLGIVLYKMGCGYKPTQIQGFKYGQGPIPFRKFDWKNRSPNLQDMIIQMLQMDPQNRPTCEQLLQHKWFDI
ncbi:hypothetical protein pb186bvf_006629 [Paramecium bursaria]